MSQALIESVEKQYIKAEQPKLAVGDTVDVHLRIVEGSKERIQVFSGVIIKIQGRGISRSITVRRIVANEGVERILPINSPRVSKIEVKRGGHVRRAKLYYLRDRVGKKRRLRDRRRGLGSVVTEPTTETAATQPGTDAAAPAQPQAEAKRPGAKAKA